MKEFKWIGFIKKNGNNICLVAFFFVIILVSLLSIQQAYYVLPSFDGAMNLQVPENLIKYGRYATSYNSIIDFDSRIQSGVPLLLPIYFLFYIFGKSVFIAQLISSMYLILAAVVIYHLTALNSNKFFALACVLLFILTPSLLRYGHHIYGEIPALFYFLSSLILLYNLEKKSVVSGTMLPFLTGFLYGLSYLTKTVMLVAIPSIMFFIIIDILLIHKLEKKHYLLMLIGFILPIVVFEGYKIMQIGADIYPEWWGKQSSSVMYHMGIKEKYESTPNVYAKMLVHTREFCKFFRMNTLVMVCFLCIPHIIFAISFLYHLISKKRDQINLALAILYGTAFTYMVWWIFITPTARAWPRRIINGYILQEIAFVISLYCLWKFLPTNKNKVAFLKKVAGGSVFAVMLLVILFQVTVNTNHISFLFKPSQGKLNAEKISKTIEMLPEKAKIFGIGWWQAPTLSFLSNRMFLNIAWHKLPEYPKKLRHTYVVVDHPDALKDLRFFVLSKTKNRLIEKQGYNYLYQIEYKSDYAYTKTYRSNRRRAMTWLVNRVKPADKIVIPEELRIKKNDWKKLKLRCVYDFVRSKKFKKLNQDDLINLTDVTILKKLQRLPEYVYKEQTSVLTFFATNKLNVPSPEIIIEEGEKITEEWVADNLINYVVGYDNIIVDDNFPFYDPQSRRLLKKFPLNHINPIKTFGAKSLEEKRLSKEPKVYIYKFDA